MRVCYDIETDGLLDQEEGKPQVSVLHSLVLKDLDTHRVWSCHDHGGGVAISEGIALLNEADLRVGHNILSYDEPVLKLLRPDFNPKGEMRDTMVMSRLIWPDVRNLDFQFQTRTGLPNKLIGSHKLEAWGYRLGQHKGDFCHTTDWKVWTPAMQTYCEGDVDVTEALFGRIASKNYSGQSIDLEHRFRKLIWLQERHGFAFDEKLAGDVYVKLASRRDEIRQEMQTAFPPRVEMMKTPAYFEAYGQRFPTKKAIEEHRKAHHLDKPFEITMGPMRTKEHPFNPDSTQQIADRFKERYGWKPTEFTDTGLPKISDDVLESMPYPEAKPLAEYQVVAKRLAQLSDGEKAWMKHVRNGRIYGWVITNGAVTGRCTHNIIVNVPKHPQPYGKEFRSMFIASPGMLLVGCDAEGLEARCLAHFLYPMDGGKYTEMILHGDKKLGTDVHSVNQKTLELDTRDDAKPWYYGFLYGAGDFKLGIQVLKDVEIEPLVARADRRTFNRCKRWLEKNNLAVTKKHIAAMVKGGQLRKKFLSGNPELSDLIDELKDRAETDGYLKGLDGRIIPIRSPHAALNTLLQNAGAVAMKQAAVLLHHACEHEFGWTHGKEYAFVTNVHDEIQGEATHGCAEPFGKKAADCIYRAGEHFGFHCKLAGEYKIGDNWHETH